MKTTSTHPVIEAEALTRIYGKDFTAVDQISFNVNEGEVFGLLGTNGAGKTSTLEILEGLVKPSRGQVRVFGKDPVKARKQIRPYQGVMMQSGGFPTDLTVVETLRMWAGTLSYPLPVDDVLSAVNLAHRANVRVKGLSGGEVRRLDLACSIVGQPRLLFLDEPTTGLDPESRRNTWQLIEELNQSGTTVVLTTHYLEEAERLADRLVIMHQGTIARGGTQREVIAGYPATIRFEPYWPTGTTPAIPDSIRQNLRETNSSLVWETMHLQRDLTALLTWARQDHVELRNFHAEEASLEQVFLDIAGAHAGATV